MSINTYSKGSAQKLSENFRVSELSCKGSGCCSQILTDDKLIEYLQNIRNHFGAAVTVTSGYRCAAHNKKVGGASNSYHTRGQAADITVKGISPAEVAKYAESIGVLGIGLYETAKDGYFVHIDTRTGKAFWYGQAQAKRETFGGAVSKVNETVKDWQNAAVADGFSLPSGADGIWGKECEAVAKKAVIKRGSKHKNLNKFFQARLVALGYSMTSSRKRDGSFDGIWGSGSVNATGAYQSHNGLTVDGRIGINTCKRLLGV